MTNELLEGSDKPAGETSKTSHGWSAERRAKQSALLRAQKPWLKSTGPKTAAGKEAARMNARQHGLRSAEFRDICRVLREQKALTETALLQALLALEETEAGTEEADMPRL